MKTQGVQCGETGPSGRPDRPGKPDEGNDFNDGLLQQIKSALSDIGKQLDSIAKALEKLIAQQNPDQTGQPQSPEEQFQQQIGDIGKRLDGLEQQIKDYVSQNEKPEKPTPTPQELLTQVEQLRKRFQQIVNLLNSGKKPGSIPPSEPLNDAYLAQPAIAYNGPNGIMDYTEYHNYYAGSGTGGAYTNSPYGYDTYRA